MDQTDTDASASPGLPSDKSRVEEPKSSWHVSRLFATIFLSLEPRVCHVLNPLPSGTFPASGRFSLLFFRFVVVGSGRQNDGRLVAQWKDPDSFDGSGAG